MSQRRTWILASFALAAVCLGLALAMGGDHWARLFKHPLADDVTDVKRQGATLWRVMLAVSGAAFIIAPLALDRLRPTNRERQKAPEVSSAELWTLLAIIAAGLVLRLPRLAESLWYDEIAAWFTYGIHGPGTIISTYSDFSIHAGFTMLTWLSMTLLESTLGYEIALRAPALFLSLASIIPMFALGRLAGGEGIHGRATGLFAAALMAILPVSVLEVEARGYSMVMCLAACATWLFVIARRSESIGPWLVYALVCGIAVWTHFIAAFVPFGHAAWLAWRALRRREWIELVQGGFALALGAIVAVTLFAPALPDLLAHRDVYFSSRGDEPRVFGAEGWHTLLQMGGSWYEWAAWPGLILAATGLVIVSRRNVPSPPPSALPSKGGGGGGLARDVLAASLLGLPIFLLTVVLAGSWIYARYALFSVPGAVLLMALALDALRRRGVLLAVVACAVLLVASLADLYVRPPKQPLRDAALFVRQHHQQGERILVIDLGHMVIDTYLGDLNPAYSLRQGATLQRDLDQVDPEWVVAYYPNHISAGNQQLLADRGFETIQRFRGWADWRHGDVIVMRRR